MCSQNIINCMAELTESDPQVCLYHFVKSEWTELATGKLLYNHSQNYIKIFFNEEITFNLSSYPALILSQDRKHFELRFMDIRDIEEDDANGKIVYFWLGKQPLSLSFLSEEQCREFIKIAMVKIQLAVDKNKEEIEDFCIQDIMKEVNSLITNIFIAGNMSMINQILAVIRASLQKKQQSQRNFQILKLAIKVSDMKVLRHLLEGENFQIVLKCLRYNPFNDKDYDYWQLYKKEAIFENCLDLNDPDILSCYEINSRAKFLKDCAACMFSELQTDRNLNNIISTNNQIILQKFVQKDSHFSDLIVLCQRNPEAFLNIITEIWELFQSVCTDVETIVIKDKIWKKFIEFNLHQKIIEAGYEIEADPKKLIMNENGRFHEKWINAFNIFLSYDWGQVQQWVVSLPTSLSLPGLLLKIFLVTNQESLMQTILTFIRQMMIPCENRMKIDQKTTVLFFNRFFSQIWDKMQIKPYLIQQYVLSVIKLYRAEPVRTRRMLIQCQVLNTLNDSIKRSKTVVISIIKLLEILLVEDNQDIFRYMQLYDLFKGLKEEYERNCYSSNVINSCFRSLLNKIVIYKDKAGSSYLANIFADQQEKSEQENN